MGFTKVVSWRAAAWTLAAGLCVAVPIKAQFGFGGLVHDAINWGELSTIATSNASQLKKAIEMFNKLEDIYSTGQATYEYAKSMGQALTHGDRMALVTVGLQRFDNYTKNTTGKTVMWPEMMNGHPELAAEAWAHATTPVDLTADLLQKLPGNAELRSQMASVEMRDGAYIQCLQTIAQARQNADHNVHSLQNLLDRVLDDSFKNNTTVAQLNLLNAGNAQRINEAQTANQLHACEVQQQIVASSTIRNQQVEQLNSYQAIEAERETGAGNIATGFAETLANHRIP